VATESIRQHGSGKYGLRTVHAKSRAGAKVQNQPQRLRMKQPHSHSHLPIRVNIGTRSQIADSAIIEFLRLIFHVANDLGKIGGPTLKA